MRWAWVMCVMVACGDDGERADADTSVVDTAVETNEADTAVTIETTESDTVEADTVEADTVEADTVEADTVEADTVEADTVEADTSMPGDVVDLDGAETIVEPPCTTCDLAVIGRGAATTTTRATKLWVVPPGNRVANAGFVDSWASWNVDDAGDGWGAFPSPFGAFMRATGSYSWGYIEQIAALEAGVTPIQFAVLLAATGSAADDYTIELDALDAQGTSVGAWAETATTTAPLGEWVLVQHAFTDVVASAVHVRLGTRDQEFWAGQFGAAFAVPSIILGAWQMRVAVNDGVFGAWQAWTPESDVTLDDVSTPQVVHVELESPSGEIVTLTTGPLSYAPPE